MKKPSKKPVVPDLKSATASILTRVADWMEADSIASQGAVFGWSGARPTKAEWAVLEEARKLAINYIRMGAK